MRPERVYDLLSKLPIKFIQNNFIGGGSKKNKITKKNKKVRKIKTKKAKKTNKNVNKSANTKKKSYLKKVGRRTIKSKKK